METVNVVPLIVCRAATAEIPGDACVRQQRWFVQLSNREKVTNIAEAVGWQPKLLELESRSGMLLLRPTKSMAGCTNGQFLRTTLADCEITAPT